MEEGRLRSDVRTLQRKTPLKILRVFTLLFLVSAAVCWGWAELKTRKASNELAEAASIGDYDSMRRIPEWPALDWFVASFILLFFAIVVGGATFLYWFTERSTKTER
jgi:hypothetical protein